MPSDQQDRRGRKRVAPAELSHSHHRGDRVDSDSEQERFLINVQYGSEHGVSYTLKEDRFGDAMDAIRQLVERAVRDGGEVKIRVAPIGGGTEREAANRARRETDASHEEEV